MPVTNVGSWSRYDFGKWIFGWGASYNSDTKDLVMSTVQIDCRLPGSVVMPPPLGDEVQGAVSVAIPQVAVVRMIQVNGQVRDFDLVALGLINVTNQLFSNVNLRAHSQRDGGLGLEFATLYVPPVG